MGHIYGVMGLDDSRQYLSLSLTTLAEISNWDMLPMQVIKKMSRFYLLARVLEVPLSLAERTVQVHDGNGRMTLKETTGLLIPASRS